ncbi:MAG: hypothetical protein ACREU7_02930, partial [Burkholderiales bacterium]
MLTSGDFHGLPTRMIRGEHVRVEFLAEAGPRIVRLFLARSDENLLAELPDFKFETPYGHYFFRGGHRLWHAPESFPRTYFPDNEGLAIDERPGGVRLTGPVESATGVRKRIEIHLHADQPALTLRHELANDGVW